jgi:ubiquinone/menaquinone biosynthesis C-methylase UbiE
MNKIEENLKWNAERWGNEDAWIQKDKFGYKWGNGKQQKYNEVTIIAEQYLLPVIGSRRDLQILEIAPGSGRFTTELIRIASTIDIMDMNEACINLCKERFKYYDSISYYVNDGMSLEKVKDKKYDLIASYDSFVHIEPAIIQKYVAQMSKLLSKDGIIWIDHSGKGETDAGHRTSMTDELMKQFAKENGLKVISQNYRNGHDCISILQ